MSKVCPICKEIKSGWTIRNGEEICCECSREIYNKEILDKASKSDNGRYFKEWSSKDRTTAFFEAFGRYVKEPNKRDIETVYHIWLWACHADHGLSKTISYTLKWAKMDLFTERDRWRE